MGAHSENAFPADTVKTIDRVYPRAIAKAVLKAGPLRHALVHYDFSHFLSAECAEGKHPDEMLVKAIAEKMDMKPPDYERFLFEASTEVSGSIAAITEFPCYNPYLDPGCQGDLLAGFQRIGFTGEDAATMHSV